MGHLSSIANTITLVAPRYVFQALREAIPDRRERLSLNLRAIEKVDIFFPWQDLRWKNSLMVTVAKGIDKYEFEEHHILILKGGEFLENWNERLLKRFDELLRKFQHEM